MIGVRFAPGTLVYVRITCNECGLGADMSPQVTNETGHAQVIETQLIDFYETYVRHKPDCSNKGGIFIENDKLVFDAVTVKLSLFSS